MTTRIGYDYCYLKVPRILLMLNYLHPGYANLEYKLSESQKFSYLETLKFSYSETLKSEGIAVLVRKSRGRSLLVASDQSDVPPDVSAFKGLRKPVLLHFSITSRAHHVRNRDSIKGA